MKLFYKQQFLVSLSCFIISLTFIAKPSIGQLLTGSTAPEFALKDVFGRPFDLSSMKARNVIVLYFFDASSRSSRAGLISLNQLYQKHKNSELVVWGITKSSANQIIDYVTNAKLQFPLLIDTKEVSEAYQVQLIMPKVYILGLGLKVMGSYQGGGNTNMDMITRKVSQSLNQYHSMLTNTIKQKFEQNNSDDIHTGYSALKRSKYTQAKYKPSMQDEIKLAIFPWKPPHQNWNKDVLSAIKRSITVNEKIKLSYSYYDSGQKISDRENFWDHSEPRYDWVRTTAEKMNYDIVLMCSVKIHETDPSHGEVAMFLIDIASGKVYREKGGSDQFDTSGRALSTDILKKLLERISKIT